MSDLQTARLFLSAEHDCGYLPQRSARNAYLDPAFEMSPERYTWLLAQGFRRSGTHVYRPYCRECTACVPVRVRAADFVPNRAQKRCLARNADITLHIVHALGDEHHALYARYLNARHPGGGMDGADRTAFHQFLECDWGTAEFWELRDRQHRLRAVAVVDRAPQALSAVYTFFDPDDTARSLGTLAVLRQIQHAREQRLAFVYLGYWIADSRKMAYKQQFRPQERLAPGGWTQAD